MQTGIDPFIYRGYGQHLPVMIALIGGGYYFVSRWTLYLPAYVSTQIFGPVGGYLVHHGLLLLLGAVPLACFARRRWGDDEGVTTYLLVLCSPIVVRGVFAEYSTAVIIPAVLCLLVLLLDDQRPASRARSLLAGALVAVALIANVFAGGLCGVIVGVWFVWRFRGNARTTIVSAGFMAVGAAALAGAGWALFQWRYGFNVYAPTFDWISTNRGEQTGFQATSSEWLDYRLWIYLPLIVLIAWVAIWWRRRLRPPGWQSSAMAMMVLVAAFHAAYEFVVGTVVLQLPFYWSYVIPLLLVGMSIVLGELISTASGWHRWIPAGLLVGAVALGPLRPDWLHLPPARWSIPLLAALVVGAAVLADRKVGRALSAGAVALVFAAVQLAPPVEPVRDGALRIDAGFDSAFRGLPVDDVKDRAGTRLSTIPWVRSPPGRQGWPAFLATSEFIDAIDELGDGFSSSMWIWVSGGWGWQFDSALGATKTNLLVNPDGMGADSGELPTGFAGRIQAGTVPSLAIIAPPDRVGPMLDQVSALLGRAPAVVMDRVFDHGQPTRVVVVHLRD